MTRRNLSHLFETRMRLPLLSVAAAATKGEAAGVESADAAAKAALCLKRRTLCVKPKIGGETNEYDACNKDNASVQDGETFASLFKPRKSVAPAEPEIIAPEPASRQEGVLRKLCFGAGPITDATETTTETIQVPISPRIASLDSHAIAHTDSGLDGAGAQPGQSLPQAADGMWATKVKSPSPVASREPRSPRWVATDEVQSTVKDVQCDRTNEMARSEVAQAWAQAPASDLSATQQALCQLTRSHLRTPPTDNTTPQLAIANANVAQVSVARAAAEEARLKFAAKAEIATSAKKASEQARLRAHAAAERAAEARRAWETSGAGQESRFRRTETHQRRPRNGAATPGSRSPPQVSLHKSGAGAPLSSSLSTPSFGRRAVSLPGSREGLRALAPHGIAGVPSEPAGSGSGSACQSPSSDGRSPATPLAWSASTSQLVAPGPPSNGLSMPPLPLCSSASTPNFGRRACSRPGSRDGTTGPAVRGALGVPSPLAGPPPLPPSPPSSPPQRAAPRSSPDMLGTCGGEDPVVLIVRALRNGAHRRLERLGHRLASSWAEPPPAPAASTASARRPQKRRPAAPTAARVPQNSPGLNSSCLPAIHTVAPAAPAPPTAAPAAAPATSCEQPRASALLLKFGDTRSMGAPESGAAVATAEPVAKTANAGDKAATAANDRTAAAGILAAAAAKTAASDDAAAVVKLPTAEPDVGEHTAPKPTAAAAKPSTAHALLLLKKPTMNTLCDAGADPVGEPSAAVHEDTASDGDEHAFVKKLTIREAGDVEGAVEEAKADVRGGEDGGSENAPSDKPNNLLKKLMLGGAGGAGGTESGPAGNGGEAGEESAPQKRPSLKLMLGGAVGAAGAGGADEGGIDDNGGEADGDAPAHKRNSLKAATSAMGIAQFLVKRASSEILEKVTEFEDAASMLKEGLKEKDKKKWLAGGCAKWCHAIVATFRSDHTLVGFVAPPEDEGALTEMQITQARTRLAHTLLLCSPHHTAAYGPHLEAKGPTELHVASVRMHDPTSLMMMTYRHTT